MQHETLCERLRPKLQTAVTLICKRLLGQNASTTPPNLPVAVKTCSIRMALLSSFLLTFMLFTAPHFTRSEPSAHVIQHEKHQDSLQLSTFLRIQARHGALSRDAKLRNTVSASPAMRFSAADAARMWLTRPAKHDRAWASGPPKRWACQTSLRASRSMCFSRTIIHSFNKIRHGLPFPETRIDMGTLLKKQLLCRLH